ncbi:hypothetical protein [Micromonospora sp. NPDC049679]|uniref:hypothetical protein n=1 Tax=Micromonospora sp. NPDC049679 TaxID=3155920 RepID=UPI0033D7C32A
MLAAAGVMRFVLGAGGDLGQRVTPGQPVTVRLSASDGRIVWVKETGQGPPDVRCEASSVDGRAMTELSNVFLTGERVELEVDNERWRGLLTVYAEPAGRYELTCVSSAAGPAPTLSVGDHPRFYGPRDTALGTLAAFALGGLSVIAGGVLAVVIALRRASHRARLGQRRMDTHNE